MSTQLNYEAKDYISIGPNFRITTNDPMIGSDGSSVYSLYAWTKGGNDVHLQSFTETGAFRMLNDKGIEIVAGNTGSDGNVDICLTGMGGDICITAMSNGTVKIKGKTIMIEAVEDLDLKAGRNINLVSGAGRIIQKANKIDQVALTGNAILDTFGKRAFALSPVGAEYIDDVFLGGLDVLGAVSSFVGIA
jgi:hypothetical protein